MKTLSCLLAAAALALALPAHADPSPPSTLAEGFDDIATLDGWSGANLSTQPGTGWFQGNPGVFPAHAGAPASYIAANFTAAASEDGQVDLWLVSPLVDFAGDLSFYLRSEGSAGYADTVEVLFGAASAASVDDFTLLLTTRAAADWTEVAYSAPSLGVGRLAFRYTGPASTANYIGIDTLQVGPIPEPPAMAMLVAGLAFLGLRRRRALFACAALALSAASFAGEPPAPGMVVVRDPQTGQLRAPTADEYKALARLAQPRAALLGAQPTVKRADGVLQRRLGEAGMTYSVISRDKDGKLTIECVQGGEPPAPAPAPHREDGYEER